VTAQIEATLQLAFLNHGLHALRMCTTTVITDEEVDEAVAAVRDALFELASYLPAARVCASARVSGTPSSG
jgi:hypothetical protein